MRTPSSEMNLSRVIPRTIVAITQPKWDSGVFHWSLDEIKNARDAQLRGDFALPARLADSFKTDDAMFTAQKNRLAPQSCVAKKMVFPQSLDIDEQEKAVLRAAFGADSYFLPEEVIYDIHHDFVHHGIGFGHIVQRHRERGDKIDFFLEHWPIRHVRWDPMKQCFVTRTENHGEVEMRHGNGEWVFFSKHSSEPWKKDAAILPGALVWAAHAFAASDWSKGSRSHGNAKVVGEMPEGFAIEDENGLTREAQQFLMLLGAIANDDGPSGIKPYGSKVDYLINSSSAWQVWQSLLENREKAAARIYLGTDGTLGASGGAPGVDITALFGVATTIVQGDLRCIERAIDTGMIRPWCALNLRDVYPGVRRSYEIPDQDEEAVRGNYADRSAKFQAAIKAAKENGFVIDQAFVNAEAEKYGVTGPTLAVSAPSGADFYAYELDGGVVTIDEVRARKGLAPLPHGQGAMTVPQAKAMAAGTTPAIQPPAQIATESATDQGPSAAQLLATKMTEAKVKRCEHGYVNRCPKCGVERDRDFDLDENGDPIWSIAWKPITA